MALALEIEYLAGVCFSALGPESDACDWPPQPDRVFSALVATWGAHGEPADERLALEWLEGLPAPVCASAEKDDRTAPTVFVPPNDPRSDRAKHALGVVPALRRRQPRRFPAARLQHPLVRHFWPAEPDAGTLAALDRLARDTAYVGHSASLTRCRFTITASVPATETSEVRRRVYPGRLSELREAYARFCKTADRKDRPSPGAPVVPSPPPPPPRRLNAFSGRWLILEHVGGEMPDLRAAAIVARGIRTALMSGYGQIGEAVPASVSGHAADGSPSRAPHLAIVPLSFTGHPFADGRVLGFALVPPAEEDLFEDEGFRRMLRKLTRRMDGRGRRIVEVKSPEGTTPNQAYAINLSLTFEPPAGRRSLDPAAYTAKSRSFATVTPIVLDRFLKKRGQERQAEIAEQVAAACRNVGLPLPQVVLADKHSALEGAPSAYPSPKAPSWLQWRLPASLAGRPLTHAVMRFAEPVDGPLLLGAGRFVGMGLCRALEGDT